MFSYWAKPQPGAGTAQGAQRPHGRDLPRVPAPLRRHRHGAAAVALARRARTRALHGRTRAAGGDRIARTSAAGTSTRPSCSEFFRAASELGAAILVHPWDMMGTDSMPKYWLPWLVGMPAEQSRAACCPGLRRRAGTAAEAEGLPRPRRRQLPYTIGRIEHGFNMRPDLVATDNFRNPREYLKRLYFDSWVADDAALRLETCGADRVMLGTDYPFPLGEQVPGEGIDRLGLNEAEQARLTTAPRWNGWGCPNRVRVIVILTRIKADKHRSPSASAVSSSIAFIRSDPRQRLFQMTNPFSDEYAQSLDAADRCARSAGNSTCRCTGRAAGLFRRQFAGPAAEGARAHVEKCSTNWANRSGRRPFHRRSGVDALPRAGARRTGARGRRKPPKWWR